MQSFGFIIKSKILSIKKYNEARFNITITSLRTHFQQIQNEHKEIGKAIKKINPDAEIKEGKDLRIQQMWEKIKADFDAVKLEYDHEFEKWEK